MTIKNTTLSLLLLLSATLFAQNSSRSKKFIIKETNSSYLDSLKKTFVKYDSATRVDSLWLKELTSLDLYNDLENDIKTINIDEKVDYELPTELLKTRLAEMDAKSPFNIEYNEGLENIIKSFLKNRKKSFERLMAISEYYFPIFEASFAKHNVPLEIKYLAVVESALNPKAVSKMGATGIWQFMYQTGKQYNLKIDSYIDERSDPVLASEAAAQYMNRMHTIFGDWNLVLASYNSGPGNVSKAIRRSGGQQNFWDIRDKLPKETQGYVPAFLATMYIYEYHKEHKIKPARAIVKHFATDTIMIKKQISFKQISDLLDIPVAQLQLLNPSYKLNVVPLYINQNHYLTLPQDKVALFTSNEDKIYAYTEHVLNKREKTFTKTASAIALKDSTPISTKTIAVSNTKYYKIKNGDNLGDIANKYDVSVIDIKKWNKLKGNAITAGKTLKIIRTENRIKTISTEDKSDKVIPEVKTESAIATVESKLNDSKDTLEVQKPNTYVVEKGDNLGEIAQKFNISIADLKQWNGLSTTTVVIGKTLTVAKNELEIVHNTATVDSFKRKDNSSSVSKKEDSNYLVKKGDSLFSISKKYPGVTITDLKKWNDITGEDLKPGMALKIKG